ncbi:arsenic metallochaperone ArsD family protein [Cedecea sp. NFIX57]|uniref:arsenic metallochaperone ArsD family protein n=1 Tax=Cedecea sp. NFIX57 TaxID=1566286 RepID=UPI000A09F543|nr:arsenic metallochaperone ArsD family protein [Cedecea sp. NFIX57]SMG11943.1 Arsenical resistance operon trans-acting repressor ArsD [Cedecea sp. NFIX57]
MSRIEIYEAAGCCATSSVNVQQADLQWSADLDWAKQNGIAIQRYNLAKNPASFINNPTVNNLLNESGSSVLPVVLVDGVLALAGKRPNRVDLARWANIPFTQDWEQHSTEPGCCTIPRLP